MILGAVLAPGSASGAAGRYLANEDLAKRATLVVSGRIADTRTSWDKPMGRIITLARMEIEETWRGPALEEIDVLVFGGAVGDIVQYVPGESKLAVDDRLLLFLRRVPGRDAWRAIGMRQGCFRKWPDGRWIRDFEGLHLLDGRAPSQGQPGAAPKAASKPAPGLVPAFDHRDVEFLSTPDIESLLSRVPFSLQDELTKAVGPEPAATPERPAKTRRAP